MATTKQVFTGDKAQLEAAYRDLAKEVVRLEAQLQKLATTSAAGTGQAMRGHADLNRLISSGVQQVAGLVMQYVSFQAVLQGVNAELQKTRELQEGARNTQVAIGDSQATVIKSLTGISSEQRRAFLQQIADVGSETEFPSLGRLNQAAAEGLSAGGDTKTVVDAVRQAARVSRNAPEDLEALVGAAIDLQKASRIEDSRRNLGFMLSVGAEARVAGTRQTALAVAPAVISSVNTVPKDSREQASIDAGALFAALGSQAGDARGLSTSTATTALAVQLRDFFEEGQEITRHGRKMKIKPPEDPGTLRGRIDLLQQDEKLRKQFLDKATFERQFQVPVQQLLMPGSDTDKAFEKSRRNIRFDPQAFEQTAADLGNLTPELKTASRERASMGAVEGHQTARTADAILASMRTITDQALNETRGYALATPPGARDMDIAFARSAYSLMGMEDTEARINLFALKRRREEIQTYDDPQGRLGPDERRSMEFVERQIKLLEESLVELRKISAPSPKEPTLAPAAAAAERGRHRER